MNKDAVAKLEFEKFVIGLLEPNIIYQDYQIGGIQNYHFHGKKAVLCFASLIQTETLERAAKVCENLEQVGWPENQEYGSYGEFSDAAIGIRALKDQP